MPINTFSECVSDKIRVTMTLGLVMDIKYVPKKLKLTGIYNREIILCNRSTFSYIAIQKKR